MEPSRGRSGVGLVGFAVLAIVLIIVVAAVAASVGHQLALAEQAVSQMAR